MQKYIINYGVIAGLLVITPMILGMIVGGEGSATASELFGYAIMLVVLSLIFVAIKRYRDRELGGVIAFGPALILGLSITAVAALAYVAVWELFLYSTDYAFIDGYTAGIIEAQREAGVSAQELEVLEAEMADMRDNYQKLWYRLPLTFLEIFPVGALVALFSAGLLRNPRILPA